ncbi:hypothetical protein Pla123a_03420 [Posidoniimonas polymericola]|uniref:Uncharacterized protein n=1 Tax=Posidoniimonas polymericola TaxID=2528002 RepID=A0A5C5ZEE6_9BACT|nr:hypothetical protein [Posidoniimonas polymericola]TWT85535.1 hypothetical protein Pla123a_03420 [Posidoniimonas polymericola]
MFELNKSISDWRANLQSAGSIDATDADELEIHLRDSLDTLGELGLSEEEAFLVAAHRVGGTPDLAVEYSKVNTTAVWRRRVRWMAAGGLALIVCQAVANTVGLAAQAVTAWLGGTGTLMGGSSVAASAAAWIAFGAVVMLTARGAVIGHGFSRIGVVGFAAAAGAILLAACAARIATTIVLVRTLPANQFGEAALQIAYGNGAVATLLPIALILLLLALRPSKAVRVQSA